MSNAALVDKKIVALETRMKNAEVKIESTSDKIMYLSKHLAQFETSSGGEGGDIQMFELMIHRLRKEMRD